MTKAIARQYLNRILKSETPCLRAPALQTVESVPSLFSAWQEHRRPPLGRFGYTAWMRPSCHDADPRMWKSGVCPGDRLVGIAEFILRSPWDPK